MLDGEWHVAGAANTAVQKRANNVVIAGRTGVFRAARNIARGNELLVDYGQAYRQALAAENRARAAGREILSADSDSGGESND